MVTSQILSYAWSFLEARFRSPHKPSAELIKNLIHGPPVPTEDVDALGNFAFSCETALALVQTRPTLASVLNEQNSQLSLINRISGELRRKWYEHKCLTFPGETVVPFSAFSKWIRHQATV